MASGVQCVTDTENTRTVQLGEYGYNSYFSGDKDAHFKRTAQILLQFLCHATRYFVKNTWKGTCYAKSKVRIMCFILICILVDLSRCVDDGW